MMNPESIQKHGLTGLIVTVSSASELDERLTSAVEQVRTTTQCRTHGILITRRSPATFVVDLSADVPAGTIYERDLT